MAPKQAPGGRPHSGEGSVTHRRQPLKSQKSLFFSPSSPSVGRNVAAVSCSPLSGSVALPASPLNPVTDPKAPSSAASFDFSAAGLVATALFRVPFPFAPTTLFFLAARDRSSLFPFSSVRLAIPVPRKSKSLPRLNACRRRPQSRFPAIVLPALRLPSSAAHIVPRVLKLLETKQ